MKTPGYVNVATLLTLVAHASIVLGSNDLNCDTELLELKDANMSDLELEIPSNCSEYVFVWIINNMIENVNADSFQEVKTPLTILQFSQNRGMNNTKIQFNADFSTTGLAEYQIMHNKLELGEDLRFPENTFKIDLENNSITDIPSGLFKNLTEVVYLNLRSNFLMSLDADMFHDLVRLRYVYFTGNKLKYIMPNAFRSPILTVIGLGDNLLSSIPADLVIFREDFEDEFHNSDFAPIIYADGNPLIRLPRCLADLDNFLYTKSTSVKICGDPDQDGTAAEDICQNASEHDFSAETCDALKPIIVQEKINRHGGVNPPAISTDLVTADNRASKEKMDQSENDPNNKADTNTEDTSSKTDISAENESNTETDKNTEDTSSKTDISATAENDPNNEADTNTDETSSRTDISSGSTVEDGEERKTHNFFVIGVVIMYPLILFLILIVISKRRRLRRLQASRHRLENMNNFEMDEMYSGVINEGSIQLAVRIIIKGNKTHKRRQMASRTSSKQPRENIGANPYSIATASRNISKRKTAQARIIGM